MIQSIGLLAFSIISTATAYNPLDLYGIIEPAVPSPVENGAQIPRNVSIDLFKRADSRDPNCPDGYQCNLNTPCDDSICSSDRFCVAFDGRNVCILRDQDSTWCRVNLGAGTLEGCNGAGRECCHGRCLPPGNKCCTFAGVKCEASDTSCQQCGPESTCGTGSCISSSSSTATGATASNPTTIPSSTSTGTATVSATTAQPPTTSVPTSESTTTSTTSVPISESTATSTTTGASTTNGASTTTTVGSGPSTTTTTGTTLIGSTDISSSSSSSSSSSIAPTPTIAPQVDAFTFGGCFVDSSDARILVADSTEDGSSDGMTIEKCVAFADDGAWRYAGVEFGSQCYVGNTMHGQDKYPDSDCKTPCAGNPAEICGDGGRIQIYEDPTWSDPTAEELADAVRQYASAVDDVRSAMVDYRASLSDLADYVSSKTKRLLLKTGPEIEADLLKHESALKAARAKLRIVSPMASVTVLADW
ncbi:unnamed protein product [Penicillium olsonii]|nr:unnamed protein product [Penicillium olsonii]CAG7917253.1 unnamed protein product [Penicillium olsonii]